MSEVMMEYFEQIKSFTDRNGFSVVESEEQNCKRLDVQHGKSKAIIKVYTNGTIQIQGTESKLKESLTALKKAIENEENIGELLPFEIERFPELLKERIQGVDPIIVRFVAEAIISLKAGSNLGCAFLLGGASEKAILLLIDQYCSAIKDESRQNSLKTKIGNRSISKIFDEFKASWKSSLNKPVNFGWTNDLEIKIEQIFQFCRICRNEAGHPHLPPNLDKGVLIANMGQFVKYIEDLYELIRYYESNEVKF